MPLELQIIRACEFIKAGAKGRRTSRPVASCSGNLPPPAAAAGLIGPCSMSGELRPGDTRIFTPSDLASLVNTFHEIGFSLGQRLAVLYSDDPYHGVRMFAFIGSLRGWKVRAFGDFEPALHWLGEVDEIFDRSQPIENRISVPSPIVTEKSRQE